MMTKGFMTKELKKKGIRSGDKNGATVKLEHLKMYQIVNLYFEHCASQDK